MERSMASKQKTTSPEEAGHGHFWQEPEKRAALSEEARKWQEENAEAIKSTNEWIERNGLPLAKYRAF
jgi:hypothetical protein